MGFALAFSMRTLSVALIGLALAMCGCTTEFARFTIAATQPVDVHPTMLQRGVEGTECLLVMGRGASPEAAIDAAIRSVPGADALANVRVNRSAYLIPLPYECMRARGDAIRLGAPPASQPPPSTGTSP